MTLSKMVVHLLLVALILDGVDCWGPAFHISTACLEVSRTSNVASCVHDAPSLAEGVQAPDAFLFAGSFLQGAGCVPESARLHDWTFAAFMVIKSIHSSSAPGFNGTQFALGFASHVYADLVGFLPGGLLLSNPSLPWAGVDWLKTWPYMTALDAAAIGYYGDPQFRFTTHASINESSTFLSSAIDQYRIAFPTVAFPIISPSEVAVCLTAWDYAVKDILEQGMLLPRDAALIQIQRASPIHIRSWNEAQSRVLGSQQCAILAWNHFLWLAFQPQADATQVTQLTLSFTASLLSAGNCSGATGLIDSPIILNNAADWILQVLLAFCTCYFVCMAVCHFFSLKFPIVFIYWDTPFFSYQDKIISFCAFNYAVVFFGTFFIRAFVPYALLMLDFTIIGLSLVNVSSSLHSVLAKSTHSDVPRKSFRFRPKSRMWYWLQTAMIAVLTLILTLAYSLSSMLPNALSIGLALGVPCSVLVMLSFAGVLATWQEKTIPLISERSSEIPLDNVK